MASRPEAVGLIEGAWARDEAPDHRAIATASRLTVAQVENLVAELAGDRMRRGKPILGAAHTGRGPQAVDRPGAARPPTPGGSADPGVGGAGGVPAGPVDTSIDWRKGENHAVASIARAYEKAAVAVAKVEELLAQAHELEREQHMLAKVDAAKAALDRARRELATARAARGDHACQGCDRRFTTAGALTQHRQYRHKEAKDAS